MAKNNVSLSQQLVNEVRALLGDAYQVTEQRVLKTNVCLQGIIIKGVGEDENNIIPQIYVEDYLQRLENGEDVTDVAKELIATYEACRIREEYDISWFLDYATVKDRVCAKLINTKLNEELLLDVPSIPFCDLSIVFYALASMGENETGSILIHNSHMEAWGVDILTIAKQAMENTPKLLGCEIKGVYEIMKETLGCDDLFDEWEEDFYMSVLSTKNCSNGSILMVYAEILDKFIAEREQKDKKTYNRVVILPSSTHEVILICLEDMAEINTLDLSEMIVSVNEECLRPIEILSTHPYVYDKHTHTMTSIA